MEEDLNKCISLLKDYQFYMNDATYPLCGEDNLEILNNFITYLEKKYGNNMKTRKIVLCRGIQGSGKTFFAKKWTLEDPDHRVRFNNDDIRNMLGQYWVPSREGLVTGMKLDFLNQAMDAGFDIIIDNMNLSPKEVNFYKTYVESFNKNNKFNYEIEFKDFFIPVEECIKRDAMRPNPIGEKVIRQTWNKYKHFIQTESVNNYIKNQLKQDSNKPKAIVLDMDSTLCFNTTGRPWYGKGAAEGMLNDIPNIPIVNLVNVYDSMGYWIFIITGRDESLKNSTETWLDNNNVMYSDVLYRKEKDFRKSAEIKKELITDLLKDYNVELIIDDAEPVVKMYREIGLTVLQPNKTI